MPFLTPAPAPSKAAKVVFVLFFNLNLPFLFFFLYLLHFVFRLLQIFFLRKISDIFFPLEAETEIRGRDSLEKKAEFFLSLSPASLSFWETSRACEVCVSL